MAGGSTHAPVRGWMRLGAGVRAHTPAPYCLRMRAWILLASLLWSFACLCLRFVRLVVCRSLPCVLSCPFCAGSIISRAIRDIHWPNPLNCPSGSYVIVDEVQCKIAVLNTEYGYWGFTVNDISLPRGCSSNGRLNTHPTGETYASSASNFNLLCGSDKGLCTQCARGCVRMGCVHMGVCMVERVFTRARACACVYACVLARLCACMRV
jgi:hypothetical protein